MRNIKLIYWVFFGIFTLLTIFFTITSKDDNKGNMILSGVALMTSSLAIGLSDKRKSQFNGSVLIWSNYNKDEFMDEDYPFDLTIRIVNNSKNSINNFVYRIKIPRKPLSTIDRSAFTRSFEHKESLICINDNFHFIPSCGEDSFIPIDFYMKLNTWKKGNIVLTIIGNNICSETYVIKPKDVNSIKDANYETPLSLKRSRIETE